MATNLVPITVAHGDGIGPEIMGACLHILNEAGARIQPETIENPYTFDGQNGFVGSQSN